MRMCSVLFSWWYQDLEAHSNWCENVPRRGWPFLPIQWLSKLFLACRTKCPAEIQCSDRHFVSLPDILLPENVQPPLFSVLDISSTLTNAGQNVRQCLNSLPDISKLCRTCPGYLIINSLFSQLQPQKKMLFLCLFPPARKKNPSPYLYPLPFSWIDGIHGKWIDIHWKCPFTLNSKRKNTFWSPTSMFSKPNLDRM